MRAFAPRNDVLSLDQHASIGDRSGEYDGKYSTRAPRPAIASTMPDTLCARRLSITTTSPGLNVGPRTLLDMDAKHRARRRPWNHHQRLETAQRKRPDQRHVNPGVPGHAVADVLASGARPHRLVIARLTPDSSTNVKRSKAIELILLW